MDVSRLESARLAGWLSGVGLSPSFRFDRARRQSEPLWSPARLRSSNTTASSKETLILFSASR